MLSFPRAVRSSRYNWMPGPRTTILDEYNRSKAAAAAKVSYVT